MKFSLALLSIVFSVSGFCSNGSSSGGGGGLAEKNVVFAFLNLSKYIQLCVNSEGCRVTTEDKTLLERIDKSLKDEGAVDRLIQFRSGKKEPHLFMIEGQLKIAKTDYSIGSPIFVNLDLLYTTEVGGTPKALGLYSAVALLIHELGHHQGITDHMYLDLLGSKVESMLLKHTQFLDGGPTARNFTVTAIDWWNTGSQFKPQYTQIIASDGQTVADITSIMVSSLRCPPDFGAARPVGANLWNLHWMGNPHGNMHLMKQRVQGRLTVFCENEQGGGGIGGHSDLAIDLGFRSKDGLTYSLSSKDTVAALVPCSNGTCH